MKTKIRIFVPNNNLNERHYIVKVVFSEFLGIPYTIEHSLPADRFTVIKDENDRALVIPDVFFALPKESWGKESSLPQTPLKNLSGLPLIYSLDGYDYANHKFDPGFFPFDLFGSCFFMLSRYEEMILPQRDQHRRFLAKYSLAFRENFLQRAIVNEYVEFLWQYLKDLWPDLERKKRSFQIIPTCDVDTPFEFLFLPAKKIFRQMAGDIIKRRSPLLALGNFLRWSLVKIGLIGFDPYNTFDLIMGTNEKKGLVGRFYFICEQTGSKFDPNYDLFHPQIQKLIKKIQKRGHQVGIHGSYDGYNDLDQFEREVARLKKICPDLKEGRNHYLRFDCLKTLSIWDKCGLEYDSTLSYADFAGFRCGTCYEYTAYDLKNREVLKIKEFPLIVMECTVIDEGYMGLGTGEEALDYMLNLKKECQKYGGNFMILWHNTRYQKKSELKLLSRSLDL